MANHENESDPHSGIQADDVAVGGKAGVARPGRRAFMQSAVFGAATVALPAAKAQTTLPAAPVELAALSPAGSPAPPPPASSAAGAAPVVLNINGRPYALSLAPTVSLLDAVRDHAGLTGTKKGCDRGQCGACTVLINGRRINSCLTLAVMHEGDEITTIEGLAQGGKHSTLQAAFIEHDAFQCGYCTPGQLCSGVGMLSEAAAGSASAATSPAGLRSLQPTQLTDAEIRERMSGNICRCGAYPNIVAAFQAVQRDNS
jgi:xanthine dehydrogenase YagT iron-sulfur-binding subunit